MILEHGCPVLIVHRRLFDNDKTRYFIGVVKNSENTLASVEGYTWVQNKFGGDFVRKEDKRTKIVGLGSHGLMIYELPHYVEVEKLVISSKTAGKIWLTEPGSSFKMDLSEAIHAP